MMGLDFILEYHSVIIGRPCNYYGKCFSFDLLSGALDRFLCQYITNIIKGVQDSMFERLR